MGRNHTYRAHTLHRPATVAQVQQLVAAADRIRVLGTRHCFTDIADSAELISLDGLSRDIVVDRAAATVSVPAGMRYGDLCPALQRRGMALANLASLPHISIAGAIATATDDRDGPRTVDLTTPGPSSDRLPHFTMDQTPSVGEELQAEYFVARRDAVGALQAVHDLSDVVQPVLHIAEIPTVAADQLWMSPQYEQDTLAIAFTLRPDADGVARALREVEAALAPFDARPHWGKLFGQDAAAIARLYPRRHDFVALIERLDPRGTFRNAWLETRVLGG